MALRIIVLEILKRFVKVIRNAELPFGATKTALFYGGCGFVGRFYGSERKNNWSRRHFIRNVKYKPAIGQDFYGLRNAHGANIA